MQFRQLILAASALVLAGASPARAQDWAAPVAGDSVLQALVAEALARNPTVAQRQAAVRAATLRIRPAGSLPDPMLSVGVMDLLLPHFEFNRSDFTEADVELSQEIPWPGGRGRCSRRRRRRAPRVDGGDGGGVLPAPIRGNSLGDPAASRRAPRSGRAAQYHALCNRHGPAERPTPGEARARSS